MTTNPITNIFYVGDGITTEFSYAFNGATGFDTKIPAEVKAAILNPDGTRDLSPNFAVMQDVNSNFTGKIQFAFAPLADALILIYRETAQTQDMDIKTSSGFNAKDMQKALDKLTRLVQELSLKIAKDTLNLDEFQLDKDGAQTGLSMQLLGATNDKQLIFYDNDTGKFFATSYTEDQVVISDTIEKIEWVPDSFGHMHLNIITNNGTTVIIDAQTQHNDLFGRDEIGAHPATAISTTDSNDDVQSSLNDKLNDISVGTDLSSTVVIEKTKNDGATIIDMPLPVAEADNGVVAGKAGIMNAAQATALVENTAMLDTLNHRSFSALGLPLNPTQAQLSAAWQAASGIDPTTLSAGIEALLFDISNSTIWSYFADVDIWTAGAPASIGYFTNSSAGIIFGSIAEGQIFAEPDGTGSVNGWDALVATATNAWNAINDFLTNTLGGLAVKATDFLTGITGTNKGLTQADALTNPTSTNKVLTQSDMFQGVSDLGTLVASQSITFNKNVADIYLLNSDGTAMTPTITLTFPTTTSAKAYTFELIITCGASVPTLTWADTILWVGGDAPELEASKKNIITLRKQGTTIIGSSAGSY